jgi:hypothetical protein
MLYDVIHNESLLDFKMGLEGVVLPALFQVVVSMPVFLKWMLNEDVKIKYQVDQSYKSNFNTLVLEFQRVFEFKGFNKIYLQRVSIPLIP